MTIKTGTLADATPEQLRDYATNFLNLDASAADSDDAIRSLIQSAQPNNPTIFYQEADTVADVAATETAEVQLRPEEAPGKIAGSLGHGDPRAVIFIPVVEAEGGDRDVPVGVNGRAWLLKRGHDLPVPWRVVAALESAIADVVTHRTDEGHEGEIDVRASSRFPFSFKERPTEAEIEAWRARIGAEFCA